MTTTARALASLVVFTVSVGSLLFVGYLELAYGMGMGAFSVQEFDRFVRLSRPALVGALALPVVLLPSLAAAVVGRWPGWTFALAALVTAVPPLTYLGAASTLY